MELVESAKILCVLIARQVLATIIRSGVDFPVWVLWIWYLLDYLSTPRDTNFHLLISESHWCDLQRMFSSDWVEIGSNVRSLSNQTKNNIRLSLKWVLLKRSRKVLRGAKQPRLQVAVMRFSSKVQLATWHIIGGPWDCRVSLRISNRCRPRTQVLRYRWIHEAAH